MKRAGLDAYIIPHSDEYQNEFIAPYAERLAWLTGFTGSAGSCAVLMDRAAVMSDGRYTLQLKSQVNQELYDLADSTKISAFDWALGQICENGGGKDFVIGYDPRLHTVDELERWEKTLKEKKGAYAGCSIAIRAVSANLVDAVWPDQPPVPTAPVTLFPDEIAGVGASEKIDWLRTVLEEENCSGFYTAAPETLCWLLNIRGNDVDFTPVVLASLLVLRDQVHLFIDPAKIEGSVCKILERAVTMHDPKDMEGALKTAIQGNESDGPIALDGGATSVYGRDLLKGMGANIRPLKDPCIQRRACKTPAEQNAIGQAHIADGRALVRFMIWLERNGGAGDQTEVSIANALENCRRQEDTYIGPSFPTICGFGENGAVIHYRAEDTRCKTIRGDGLLLIDSGGQYRWGTTDITRVFMMGENILPEMRRDYTLVLKGHIALAMAKFPAGTTGAQLDSFARGPLWNAGLDYAHGTGHGVGCYLSVHEEASHISPRGKATLLPGMLLSNEPGYYKEGAYGIRLENLILVEEGGGTYTDTNKKILGFKTVSLAPFERALIDGAILNMDEIEWLNSYHQDIYNTLRDGLSHDEQNWLKDKTRPLD